MIVRLELTKENKLKAFLIKDGKTISEKLIKGKFKKDNCYYTKRVFYVVPILPILWCFKNEQERIYLTDSTLIYESTYNYGGAVIIMAGGNSGNYKWMFTKIED